MRSPPPPSPKPKRPITSQKPAPSPKPALRSKIPVPPPAKPKPVLEPVKPVQPVANHPAIYNLHEKEREEFTPNKAGFAEAQAQLAKNLRGTIKRGNSLNAADVAETPTTAPLTVSNFPPPRTDSTSSADLPSTPLSPYQPRSPSPPLAAVPYQPRPPTPVSPDACLPMDDLPPPPPDLLQESDLNTPRKSKISEMVKNLGAQKEEASTPVKKVDVAEGQERSSSVSELTSMLNKTLKKSQTSSKLMSQAPPPKPPSKPALGKMNRSVTCPQMGPPVLDDSPSHPPQPSRSGSVHQRAANLAASLVLQRPLDSCQTPPVQQAPDNQVPLPPPKQFSNQPPQQQAVSATPMQPPQQQQPASYAAPIQRTPNQSAPMRVPPKPPTYRAPQYQEAPLPQDAMSPPPPSQGTPLPPSRIPGPMRAPPPAVPPASNYQMPPLPSRKDSLLASQHRNRTTSNTSGSSAGSLAGCAPRLAEVMVPPHPHIIPRQEDLVMPPPRTTSTLMRRGEMATTANTVNTAGQPDVLDMRQRQELAPRHPLHLPPSAASSSIPSRHASNASSAGPPPRSWHDTLLREIPGNLVTILS